MNDESRDNQRPEGLSDDLFEKIRWMQLAVIRKENQLTQAQVANKVDLKQSTLSHIEHGRMVPSKENKARLAAFFMGNDWLKNGYSSSDTVIFEKLLADKIDWSKHHHLVPNNINDSEMLFTAFKKRKSLKRSSLLKQMARDDLDEATAYNRSRPEHRQAFTEFARPPRINKYKEGVRVVGNLFITSGVLIDTANADTIVTPRVLENKAGAYSLEVIDNAMSPRYETGDIVHVDPTLNAIIGDDVVVRLEYKDKVVGIVRQVSNITINKGQDTGTVELQAIQQRSSAAYQVGMYETEERQQGNDLDWNDLDDYFHEIMRREALTIEIDRRYNCISISGQDDDIKPEGKVIKADVHVIVGCDRKPVPIGNRAMKLHMDAGTGMFSYGAGSFGVGPFGGKKG